MFNSIDLILAMGFAWMISGICLLFLNRRNNFTSAWFSSLLILVFGMTLLDNFIKPEMFSELVVDTLFLVSRNSYFLIGPFLLFYTKGLLFKKQRGIVNMLHLIPFFIAVLYSVYNTSVLFPMDESSDILVKPGLLSMPGIILNVFSILSRGSYCFLVLKIISSHAKAVPDFYSRKTIRNTLSWLYFLVLFYLILFSLNFVLLFFPRGTNLFFRSIIVIVRLAPAILFIFLFSLFAQNQAMPEDRRVKKVYTGSGLIKDSDSIEESNKEIRENEENTTVKEIKETIKSKIDIKEVDFSSEKEKYRNSSLSLEESQQLYEQLNLYISNSRIYLDPDLTLNTLAEKFGETRHRLSETINRESNEKFYGYINDFRLSEFIKSIDEKRYPHFTILAIALECGFKSTSAFYSYFKKRVGMTPKEYMNKLA